VERVARRRKGEVHCAFKTARSLAATHRPDPQPGPPGTLVIETSTNLAGWATVFTNTTPTNVLFYTDPEAGSHLWRFYRAFQFP
jgi:hypothetical protein